MDMLLGLRNAKETPEEPRDYNVLDLVDRVDYVLAEHGFARRYIGFDEEGRANFSVYYGSRGSASLKFVSDESELIPWIIGGKVMAMCPVYIRLKNVPQRVFDSIKRDAEEI